MPTPAASPAATPRAMHRRLRAVASQHAISPVPAGGGRHAGSSGEALRERGGASFGNTWYSCDSTLRCEKYSAGARGRASAGAPGAAWLPRARDPPIGAPDGLSALRIRRAQIGQYVAPTGRCVAEPVGGRITSRAGPRADARVPKDGPLLNSNGGEVWPRRAGSIVIQRILAPPTSFRLRRSHDLTGAGEHQRGGARRAA